MCYSLRTLLLLLLAVPPALAALHTTIQEKVAEQLLPCITSNWGIAPRAQSFCLLTVTPRFIIQEEEEGLLGLELSPTDSAEEPRN